MIAPTEQRNQLSGVERSPYRIHLALLLCAAGSFYISTLDWHGYWQDEIRTLQSGRLSFHGMIIERAGSGHQPLYFALSFFWQQLFGESERALRMPATLFGLMSLAALFRVVETLLDAKTALLAAFLLALSPMQLFFCQMARMYTLVQFLSLAATYVMIREQITWRQMSVFTALWTLNLYTHFSAYLVLATHVVYLAFSSRPRRNLLFGAGFAILLHLNWLFLFPEINAANRHLGWLPKLIEPVLSLEVINSVAFGNYFVEVGRYTVGLLLSTTFTGMALCGALLIWRRARLLALLWLVPFAVALLLSAVDLNLIRINRYFSTSIAAQAALISVFLTTVPWKTRYVRWFWTVAVLLTMSLGVRFYFIRHPIPPAWREMAAIIRDQGTLNELVMVVGDSPASPFQHYYGSNYHAISSSEEQFPYQGDGIWLCIPANRRNIGMQVVHKLRDKFTSMKRIPVGRDELIHLHSPKASGNVDRSYRDFLIAA